MGLSLLVLWRIARAPNEYYVIESSNPKIERFDGAAKSFAEYLAESAK